MRPLFLFLIAILTLTNAGAQYVRIGDGSYYGTVGGPFSVNTTLANYTTRFAYIFPRSVLGNIKHGDTISSMEFSRVSGAVQNSSCNLTLYVKNTSQSDFGSGKLYWPGETAGAVRVYDQNPTLEINANEGFQKIPFYNKLFYFDTTKGDNLELLVEYKQTAVQSAVIYWYFENGSTVSGYSSNQTKSFIGTTANDSLGTSSDYHPTMILNYPRFDKDIAIIKVYTLGKIPVPLGNPDSVKALIRNVGKKNQTGLKLNTYIVGRNKNQIDSTAISINVGEQKFVNIPSLSPQKKGMDTVFVVVNKDANPTNDTGYSYRLSNENVYSYRDVTQPPAAGGIGFNGSTGDFVARFFSNKSKNINQVTVNFALNGRPFKIGIWDSKKNNIPGNLIYLSDSLISVAGNYILDFKKPVQVAGSFFVGVRQLGTNNVAFGYQIEDPVRPNTFYYAAPAKDTNWLDFYPDAPFRFLIEPRLQGDTDLTVLSADYPKDSIDRYTTDSLAPVCTVGNIGVKDILDSFRITCEISFYGKLLYKKTIRDTMSSGRKRTYTFPKTFYPLNYGENIVKFYTSHKHDQIIDNDTATRKFYVGVKNDVIVQTVYEPSNNSIYEYLRDTFTPVAAVQNVGYNNSPSFNAKCIIKKGSTIVYSNTQSLSLPKFQSKILNWPTYICKDTGKLQVLFIVDMATDKNRNNDTFKRNVFVFKSFDVGVDSAQIPNKNAFYLVGKPMKPYVKVSNDGVLAAYGSKLYYTIKSAYTASVWKDSLTIDILAKESKWLPFIKSFTPPKRGVYTITFSIFHSGDLVKLNDTLRYNFNVGYPYDYTGLKVIYPVITDTLSVGSGPYAPKIRIKNNGFIKNNDLVPVVCQIWWKNNRVYQDIKSLNLDTSFTFDQTFTQTFDPVNSGNYDVIAYTNYVSDVNKTNDTVRSKFFVSIGKDAYVQSIDTPLFTDNYTAKISQVKIRATIANYGKIKIAPVRLYAEIFKGNTNVYYQYLDDSLAGHGSKQITFTTLFTPQDSGIYKLMLHTFSMLDQNIFNDTTIGYFNVNKGKDIGIVKWINPLNSSTLPRQYDPSKPAVLVKNVGSDTTPVDGKVYFTFYDSSGSNIVFSDSGSFAKLTPGNTDTVRANGTWDFFKYGIYKTTAIVKANDLFPVNDTLSGAFRIIVNGVNRISSGLIKVYPNPVTGILHIESPYNITSLELHDLTGRKIQISSSNLKSPDLSGVSNGAYILVIGTSEGVYSLS